METHTLSGCCGCGRNRYVVEIPSQHVQQAQVIYDNTSASRLHSATPCTLWLRVPLQWFTSATFAQQPDETRSSIRRTFASPFASHSHRRQFCGYCGTQLTSWDERSRDEAEHICLTVGSLLDEDQALLGDLGLLPGGESSDEEAMVNIAEASGMATARTRGTPWFEEMVQHTRLGRLKQQRGGHSGSGVHVEWEVVEWTEGDDADDESHSSHSTKRKIGDIEAGEGSEMQI